MSKESLIKDLCQENNILTDEEVLEELIDENYNTTSEYNLYRDKITTINTYEK